MQLFQIDPPQCYQVYASIKGWATIGFSEAIKTLPWALATMYLMVNIALMIFKGKVILTNVNKVK